MESWIVEGFITGATKSAFIIYDEVKSRFSKNPASADSPSKRVNWQVIPLAKHEDGRFAYGLVNTSSASARNVEVHSRDTEWRITFWGTTDWQREIGNDEVLVFIARVDGQGPFDKPEVTVEWEDRDGMTRTHPFPVQVRGSFLGDLLFELE